LLSCLAAHLNSPSSPPPGNSLQNSLQHVTRSRKGVAQESAQGAGQ
jgi:hypothetical protein